MSVVYSGEVADRLPELINPDVEQVAVNDPRYLEHLDDVSQNNEKIQIFGREVLGRLGPGSLAPGWVKSNFIIMQNRYPQAMAPIIEKFGGLDDLTPGNGGDQKFTRWLRRYVEHYEAETDALAGRMDQLIEEFGNLLVDKYPFVSASVVEERLARTSVGYYDFMQRLLMSKKTDDKPFGKYTYGRYSLVDSHISIGLDEDAFTLRDRIVSHEAIHATSGRSIQLVDEASSGRIVRKFQETRLGLERYDAKGNPINRLINEAQTERINLGLYGYPKHNACYPEERDILTDLIYSGKFKLDPELFVRAYFENEDPVAGTPAMEELEAELHRAYGQNILTVIEGTVENATSAPKGRAQVKKYLKSHKQKNSAMPVAA